MLGSEAPKRLGRAPAAWGSGLPAQKLLPFTVPANPEQAFFQLYVPANPLCCTFVEHTSHARPQDGAGLKEGRPKPPTSKRNRRRTRTGYSNRSPAKRAKPHRRERPAKSSQKPALHEKEQQQQPKTEAEQKQYPARPEHKSKAA